MFDGLSPSRKTCCNPKQQLESFFLDQKTLKSLFRRDETEKNCNKRLPPPFSPPSAPLLYLALTQEALVEEFSPYFYYS